jgi:hypothetical protein
MIRRDLMASVYAVRFGGTALRAHFLYFWWLSTRMRMSVPRPEFQIG